MKLYIVKNNQAGADLGYKIIREDFDKGAIKVLGLATGSTPLNLYKNFVNSDIDFTDTVSINLDEYKGIGKDHDQSYDFFMRKNLFNSKPFKVNYLPDGLAADAEAECKRYDAIIDENPIDLQILGLGTNGHIGFNEPGASFDSLTQVVDLAEETIEANARFFANKEDVPKEAISMGIKSILSAKKIVLFAYGSAKADAVYKMLEEAPSTNLPASALQNHPDVTIIVDTEAASKLDAKKYQ